MKHLNLVSYFGGKYPHLNWLLPQFPQGKYHFVDIMCGGANVALNVDYPLITVNDINDEILNLFHVLRTRHEEFIRALYFTPFSRAEHERIINNYYGPCDDVERARRYFVRSQLGYGANGSQNNHHGVGFEWKTARSDFYRVDNWNEKLKKLPAIIDKLRQMQIESASVFDLYPKVNKPGNIIYLDPPYLMEVRRNKKRYHHDCDDDFHEKLSDMLRNSNALIAVSGYESKLYDDMFPYLEKVEGPETASNTKNVKRKECLWVNYDINDYNPQQQLFDGKN